MNYKKHIDNRGYFQELARKSDMIFEPKQVSVCTINPGVTRGGHFHKETWEQFIIIEGHATVTFEYPDGFTVHESISFDGTDMNIPHVTVRNFANITPEVKHSIFSASGCKFLILSSKEFDPQYPDTYTDWKDL